MKGKKIRDLGLKTIYSILSVLWGIAIAGGVLTIIMCVVNIFVKGQTWPIDFVKANLDTKLLGLDEILPKDVFIGNAQLTLFIYKPSTLLIIISYLKLLTYEIIFAYLVFSTRKIILTVLDESPFIKRNADRIRKIGTVLVAVPILTSIVTLLISYLNLLNLGYYYSIKGIKSIFINLNIFDWNAVLFGFLFLAISEVFRIGVKLKEEQDLTV